MTGPGSAAARTRLSWQRTGLGLLVLGALLLRQGLVRASWPESAAGLIALACAAGCAARAVTGRVGGHGATGPRLLTGCVLVVCLLAVHGVLAG